ncbi:hypothetical protein BGZ91_006789 [Linnemannia elongata]|nr:hypothetical protein BGZ91_006789 [Linnemannia elongata]
MAKKKTTVRKSTRQSTYPHRNSTTNSKAASVSPSNASSPSPPPQSDNHHHHHQHHHAHTVSSSSSSSASSPTSPAAMTTCGSSSSSRRKGLPRRSPSQNDPSKGIVFSFRFQNDPGLSMAVDIRSYDQQFGPPDPDSFEKADSKTAGPSAGSSSLSLAGSHALLHKSADDTIKAGSIQGGAAGGVVRMNGGHWSSDPTAYKNSNVYDQTRNLLILHTRKPSPQAAPSGSSRAESGVSPTTTTAAAGAQASTITTTATTVTKGAVTPVSTSSSALSNNNHSAAFHPYRTQRRSSTSSSSQSSSPTSSFLSTPALSQTGSSSSSSYASSSSVSSSPSSPTSPRSLSSPSVSRQQLTKCGGDSGLPMPLTLDALSAAQSSTRFLNVRGLGGASRGRRMQVILVS